MTSNERKIFWDALCSADGNNIIDDSQKIMSTIKYPQYLYRYRPVNNNTLSALQFNELHYSPASKYDDPFDTFLHVDKKEIKKSIDDIFSLGDKKNNIINFYIDKMKCDEQMSNFIRETLNSPNSEKIIEYIYDNNLLPLLENIRNELQKEIQSVCFSENGLNETLWLKYADKHKGFCLQYDLCNAENFLCGNYEPCKTCINNILEHTPLYPVFYSEEKYDATKFAGYIAMKKVLQQYSKELSDGILKLMGNFTWEKEKISLIKKKVHEYDEEWRIICPLTHEFQVFQNFHLKKEWIPSAIILGLRMKQNEENLVTTIAKNAGIKKIYKCIINDCDELELQEKL